VPFFAFGLSLGDKIYARRTDLALEYAGVADRSGHSTYRVFLAETTDRVRVDECWRQLKAFGCGRETATARLWALDLSPEVDIFKVYEVLENGEAEGLWMFEEGHVGHPLPARGEGA
jgi:hypothetical protein